MVKVTYEVKEANGTTYKTASYTKAHNNGNKIIRTTYEPIADEVALKAREELIEFRRKHGNK